jgi:FMN phosphatase YigB (HAD superfamily)
MYIGDNPLTDIIAPSSIGMITVLNKRLDKYKKIDISIKPKHVITDFYDLLRILDRHYNIKV